MVFGLPTLTVLELSFILQHLKITHGIVRPKGLERVVLEKTLPRIPIVFCSAKCFSQYREKFKVPITALVVDSPVVLHKEYQIPIVGADVSKTQVLLSPSLGFKEIAHLVTTDFGVPPDPGKKRVLYDPVPDILKAYRASSLSTLQTQLYRIKDKDVRQEVSKIVKVYFSSRESLDSLRRKIQKVGTEKIAETFVDLVSTPDMKTLREAVQAAKSKPTKINSLAKKLKISPFDIRYLLSARS